MLKFLFIKIEMKRIKIILLLAGLVLISSCVSQRGAYREMGRMRAEMFYSDADVYYNQDSNKSETVMYIELPVENLLYQINYKNNLYESPVTFTINIVSQSDSDVVRKVYNEFSSYTEKELKDKMKQSLYFVYKYFIPSGKYKAKIKIKDENSENEFTKSFDLLVNDFTAKNITVSDMLILKKYVVNENGTKDITPLIKNNIFGENDLHLFFEIYNNTGNDLAAAYIIKLSDEKNKTVWQDSVSYNLKPGRNREVEKIYAPGKLFNNGKPYKSEKNSAEYKIELIDKSTNETAASKNLKNIPPFAPQMMYRPPRY